MHKHSKKLKKMDACSRAVEWADKFKTSQEVWDACERGDWMLWLLGKLSGLPRSKSRKKLVLTACKCARLAWPYVRKEDKAVVKKCYETAEKWAQGKGATLKDVRNAAYAANAAAYAAYAADAAANAANAANAAANAAYAAAYAANAAANAAYAAKDRFQKKCADIVRQDYPKAPKL